MADFFSATATVSGSPVVKFPTGTTGINDNGAASRPKPITPVPPRAPRDFPREIPSWKGRRPSSHWPIEDGQGRLLGLRVRFDIGPEGKVVLPLTWCSRPDGSEGWEWRGLPDPMPLLGLPALAARPNAPVLVVEGEKKVDPANMLFREHIAVSPIGGGNSVGITDWSPLAGRRVTVWPDNDQKGREFAEACAEYALEAGAVEVRIVDVPDSFPEKWDLADPPPDGVTVEDLHGIFADARSRVPQLPRTLTLLADITALTTANSLVKGLLGKGGLSVLYGDSNVGKTFLACDLALHVALGWEWFDRRVEQCGVIYIAAEGGYGIRNRVDAFKIRHGVTGAPFAIDTSAIDLCDPNADTDGLIKTVRGARPMLGWPAGLVIIDTLSRAMAGGNENDPKDMGALVKNVDRVRAETGAHVLLIHHSGKDTTKGARGHSLLRAAVDTEIEVTRDGNGVATVAVRKQRDLPPGEGIAFRLDAVTMGEDEDGDPVTSCVVVPEANAVAVRQRARLSPQQERAVDQLKNCLADCGKRITGNRDVPSTVRVVDLDYWRDRLKKAGIQSDNSRSESAQWCKIKSNLADKGIIRMWEDKVWLTERDVNGVNECQQVNTVNGRCAVNGQRPPIRGVDQLTPALGQPNRIEAPAGKVPEDQPPAGDADTPSAVASRCSDADLPTGAVAYAFQGDIIRLTLAEIFDLGKAYPRIHDIEAALRDIDAGLATLEEPPADWTGFLRMGLRPNAKRKPPPPRPAADPFSLDDWEGDG